jgi:hypothetical protein
MNLHDRVFVFVRVRARARVRVCVRARACVCACARARACVRELGHMLSRLSLMPGICRPCNKPAISIKCNFTSGCVITSFFIRVLFHGIIN